MEILVSWIGLTDLTALHGCRTKKIWNKIEKIIPYSVERPPENGGPINTLLSEKTFDKIYLLHTYEDDIVDAYIKLLPKNKIETSKHIKIFKTPTDYSKVYNVANEFLEKILKKQTKNNTELSFLLSAGTPTMAAIWLLLGKTKYPATFWQTNSGNSLHKTCVPNNIEKVDIPFDITLDVVNELINDYDKNIQHLTTHSPKDVKGFENIAGDSKAIRMAVGRAKKVAIHGVSVLLNGESGTGKELFAKAIHNASPRKGKKFIAINCAALSSNLLESELFGHAKGSFTGADREKKGVFSEADGGTLFLDEIGECDLQMQATLLRVLQPPQGGSLCCREFTPVGGSKLQKTDVRIIAATNRNLIKMIEDNSFRADLFYRIAMITVNLPALRDRKSDIEPIAKNLLDEINKSLSKDKTFYPSTINFIKKHNWRGNVRELKNVILQAVVMSENKKLTPEDISGALAQTPDFSHGQSNLLELPLGGDFDINKHLDEIYAHYIKRALKDSSNKSSKAAELLGLANYQTLKNKIEKLSIEIDSD